MFRIATLVVALITLSARADNSTDYAWVGNLIQKKLSAQSIKIHFDGKKFIAKVTFSKDSAIIIAGGIGESKFEEIATDIANLNASVAAASFRQEKFGTGTPITPIRITTAFAQKGEWIMETKNKYTGVKILDVDKIVFAE